MTTSKAIRQHWPNREQDSSAVALQKIAYRLRARHGLSYRDVRLYFERMVGTTIPATDFEEVMEDRLQPA